MRPRSTRALPTILAVAASAAAAAAAAVILTTGPAAAAGVTVPLHAAHVGASAADFASGDCAEDGATPSAGTVRWVFVLPHNDADFISLSLTFRTAAGATAAVSVPDAADGYPDAITSNGTSKAWVVLPAGWTLQGGTAVVDGATKARFFNLTHTCIGAGKPTPTPSTPSSPDTSPDTSPSVTASPDTPGGGGPAPGGTPSASGGPSGDVSASPSPLPAVEPANETTGGLPRTGTALAGLLVLGGAATVVGAGLRWRYRRGGLAGVPPVP
jgi:hypothetical protein